MKLGIRNGTARLLMMAVFSIGLSLCLTHKAMALSSATITPDPLTGYFDCQAAFDEVAGPATEGWYTTIYVDGSLFYFSETPVTPGLEFDGFVDVTAPLPTVLHGTHTCTFFGTSYGGPGSGPGIMWNITATYTFP